MAANCGSADWAQIASASNAFRDGTLGNMPEEDNRVKKLQEKAWGLQTLVNKPGGRLGEAYKREVYRVTSRAITHCGNAPYIEEKDFMKQAEVFWKEIEAKRKEVESREVEVLEDRKGKCLIRAGGAGGYSIGQREDSYVVAATGGVPEKKDVYKAATIYPVSTSTPVIKEVRTGATLLSAGEVAARCNDDPEALTLGDLGLRDADLDAVFEGLRRGGSTLTALNLSNNAIGDAGIQRLAAELVKGTCPNLIDLWVGGNSFGDLGEQVLTGGLSILRKRLTVHLAQNEESGASIGSSASAQIAPRTVDEGHTSCSAAVQSKSGMGDGESSTTAGSDKCLHDEESAESCNVSSKQQCSSVSEGPPSNKRGGDDVCGVQVEVRPIAEAGDGVKEVRAIVPLLDSVSSAQDLELDVSRHRFRVVINSDQTVLADAEFPFPVDPDSTQAKFSSKKRTITLILKAEVPQEKTRGSDQSRIPRGSRWT